MRSDETQIPKFSFLQKAGVFAPAAIGLTGVELLLQAPLPLEVAFLTSAFVLAYKSPEIYASMRNHYPNMPAIAAIEKAHAQAQNKTDWSLTDRLMGKHMNGSYQPQRLVQTSQAQQTPTQTAADEPTNEEYSGWNDAGDVDEALSLGDNKKYLFSEVLDAGFKPSLNKIFLGRLSNGEAVYVAVKDLCHVALAGLTGNGKGNLMRLIMAQLCAVGVKVVMLNPHYMPYDESGGEDWTPFIPKLETHPEKCAEYASIAQYIKHIAVDVLRLRIERRRKNQPMGKPYFVVIDELPAVVGKVKDAPGYIGELLREGRKFGIYLILASQDFQVKTIGVDGGGVRKCLKTVFYVGGDQATARALLGEDESGKQIVVPENDLGMGTVMLRCSAVRYPAIAQVPYVDNEAIYRLVGPSTLDQFTASETQTDELSPTFNDDWKALTGHDLHEVADSPWQERTSSVLEPVQPLPTPIIQEKGPRAADIDLGGAIILWNSGYNSENKLMKAYPGLTKNQANKLRERILGQANAKQEEVE